MYIHDKTLLLLLFFYKYFFNFFHGFWVFLHSPESIVSIYSHRARSEVLLPTPQLNIFNTHLHFCHCCHHAENSYQYHCENDLWKRFIEKKICQNKRPIQQQQLLLVPTANGTTTTHVPVIASVSKAQGVICSFQLPNFHLQFLVSFVLNAYSLFQHKILVPQPFIFQSYSGRRFGRDSRRVGFDGGDFICTITSLQDVPPAFETRPSISTSR